MFSSSGRTGEGLGVVLWSEFISGSLCPSLTTQVKTVLVVASPLPGYIKNTEKLNYGKEHQYKLTVTAYDCGKKRATEDVLVKISVKPTCSPGWQGELPSLWLLCPF